MKIAVKDLEFNPFRNMKKYPIRREKIEGLKNSIKETTFWDNVLCRPHPKKKGKYEIAYGHHRLISLRELRIKTVDIPVRKLTDGQMIQIMANENLDAWGNTPAVVNETVLAAKDYLDKEIAKYETLKMTDRFISHLFTNVKSFTNAKRDGVGRDSLKKFLGGNYKEWMIQGALATLKMEKEGVLDREAVEELDNLEQADKFRRVVKENKIPVRSQKGIVKRLKKEGVVSRDIPMRVKEITKKPRDKLKPLKRIPWFDEFVRNLIGKMFNVNTELDKVTPVIANIQEERTKKGFYKECKKLRNKLNDIIESEV